jgi:hypothetical protein
MTGPAADAERETLGGGDAVRGEDGGWKASSATCERPWSAGATRWARSPRPCGRWKQATPAAGSSSPRKHRQGDPLGLAAMGANLAIVGRDRESTETAARELHAAGGEPVEVIDVLVNNLLLDRLQESAPAQVVTVSSNAQARGRIHFNDLQGSGPTPAPGPTASQARQRPVHLRAGQEAVGHLGHRRCAVSGRDAHIVRR